MFLTFESIPEFRKYSSCLCRYIFLLLQSITILFLHLPRAKNYSYQEMCKNVQPVSKTYCLVPFLKPSAKPSLFLSAPAAPLLSGSYVFPVPGVGSCQFLLEWVMVLKYRSGHGCPLCVFERPSQPFWNKDCSGNQTFFFFSFFTFSPLFSLALWSRNLQFPESIVFSFTSRLSHLVISSWNILCTHPCLHLVTKKFTHLPWYRYHGLHEVLPKVGSVHSYYVGPFS